MNLDHLLNALFAAPEIGDDDVPASVDQAYNRWQTRWRETGDAFSAAVLNGFEADRTAWAFLGGYQSALRVLFPRLVEREGCVSLCVSEVGGNHPRAIETRLSARGRGFVLNGKKQWSTLSDRAGYLMVAARVDAPNAPRPELKVIEIPADAAGVARKPMPATPFVPEVTHCQIAFSDVAVEKRSILLGDGYSDYVKPFRLIEDCYVDAAIAGYFFRLARAYAWPAMVVEQLLNIISTLHQITKLPGDSAVGHLLFTQANAAFSELAEPKAAHWASVPAEVAQRWLRDFQLLTIAAKPRAIRYERAKQSLGQS